MFINYRIDYMGRKLKSKNQSAYDWEAENPNLIYGSLKHYQYLFDVFDGLLHFPKFSNPEMEICRSVVSEKIGYLKLEQKPK